MGTGPKFQMTPILIPILSLTMWEIFTLKNNPSVTYYASETEDMADQDVSAFYQGNVLIDYVIKGSNQSIKPTYTDTAMTSIYGLMVDLKTTTQQKIISNAQTILF